MVVFLLKLIFSLLTTFSSLLTRLVFSTAAHVLVQAIQLFKTSGGNGQKVMDQVKDLITKCMEFLMNLIVKALSSALSFLLDFVKEGVFGSSSGLAVAMAGLLEKSKTSLEDAFQYFPEVLDAFTQMVGKIFADILKNCSEAVAYVAENVLN